MNKPRLNTMAYFATGIAVTWFTSVLLFAAPPATKFQRGQTLDPGCLPTDPNCSVEDFVDTDAQTLALSGSTLSILH